MNRYVITVKSARGKIIVRKDFENYDTAMNELERVEQEFADRYAIEFNTKFGGK